MAQNHNPVFISNIIINNASYSETGNSKKSAESKLAEKVYNSIEIFKKNTDKKEKCSDITTLDINSYENILLIDGENIDIDTNKINVDDLLLIFAAKNTTKNAIFQLQDLYNNCFVILSQSVGRDAADHLMTFIAGKLAVLFPNKLYYIITKDHYGAHLEMFMKNCKYICNFDEIY